MAHYAFLDENNVVTQVIVGRDEGEDDIDWEEFYGAKRTSYNTKGGVYYDPNTNQPHADQSKAFRKNYAGIGFTYDPIRDAFIPPKPHASWILDDQTCQWNAPIPKPMVPEGYYQEFKWDEDTISWLPNGPLEPI